MSTHGPDVTTRHDQPVLTSADFSEYVRFPMREETAHGIDQLSPAYRAKLKTALESLGGRHPVGIVNAVEHQAPAVFSLTLDVHEMIQRISDYVDVGIDHSFGTARRIVDAIEQDEKTVFTSNVPTQEQSQYYRAVYLAKMLDDYAQFLGSALTLIKIINQDFARFEAASPILFARVWVEGVSTEATVMEAVDLASRYPDRFHEIAAIVKDRKSFDIGLIEEALAIRNPALSDGTL